MGSGKQKWGGSRILPRDLLRPEHSVASGFPAPLEGAAVRNQTISIAHGPFNHQTFTETSCLPGATRNNIDGLLSVKVDQVDEVSQDRAGHRRQRGAVVRTHSAGPCANTCHTVDQLWDIGQDPSPL